MSEQFLSESFEEFPGAVTLCDENGIIRYMNRKAADVFQADGGGDLVGRNVLDCHPEPSRTKLETMLRIGERNVYTIEKNGVHKLIYQAPWYRDGVFGGLVELSLEIPAKMPHFVRGQPKATTGD
ncbi:MAG: PAS domain S-box protein [Acidobacteria bacterium]|nr:PAS domain S-box protein [Acidobacteriota bacterium]